MEVIFVFQNFSLSEVGTLKGVAVAIALLVEEIACQFQHKVCWSSKSFLEISVKDCRGWKKMVEGKEMKRIYCCCH